MKHNNAEQHLLRYPIPLGRLLIVFFCVVSLYPLLQPFYKIIDDPTHLRILAGLDTSLQHDGIGGFVHNLLHIDVQEGSRLLPVYFLYRFLVYKFLGTSPLFAHLSLTLVLLVVLQLQFSLVRILGYSLSTALVAVVLFSLFGQEKWSSNFYNWNDLSTFESLQVVMLLALMLCFCWLRRREQHTADEPAPAGVALLFILSLLFYFTKETGIVLVPYALLIGALEFILLKRLSKTSKWFIGFQLGCGIFFLGIYFLVAGRAPRGQYVGAFSFSPLALLSGSKQIAKYVLDNYGVLLTLLTATFLVRLLRVLKCEAEKREGLFTHLVILLGGLCFLAVLLPFQKILKERMLLPGVAFIAMFLAMEMEHLVRSVREVKTREGKSILMAPLFLSLVALPLMVLALLLLGNTSLIPEPPYLRVVRIVGHLFIIGVGGYLGILVYWQLRTNLLIKAVAHILLPCYLLLFFAIGMLSLYSFFGHLHMDYAAEYKAVRMLSQALPRDASALIASSSPHYFFGGAEQLLRLHFQRSDLQVVGEPELAAAQEQLAGKKHYLLFVPRLNNFKPFNGERYSRLLGTQPEPLLTIVHRYSYLHHYRLSFIWEKLCHLFIPGFEKKLLTKQRLFNRIVLYQLTP